ncbi:phage tail protein [Salmonella enterica subsp. enterica serovar Kentucky]|nr:phage tail protein [Salmonella enterica subsp. enterica serovar Kentucky]
MHLPNGSQIFIENTRGSEIKATAISNATDPVFTASDTGGLKKGDYVIVTVSTWGKLLDRVLRVKEVSDNTSFTLEGIDTTDENVFPSGATGSVMKIESWTEIPCVQDLGQDGGEQQYYNYQCLSDDQEQQLPTYKSAVSLTYTFAHEYDNPIYPLLRKADESGDVKALRMYVPKAKEMRLWAGVLSFNEIPQTSVNEMETVSLSVSLKGRFTFLPSTQA